MVLLLVVVDVVIVFVVGDWVRVVGLVVVVVVEVDVRSPYATTLNTAAISLSLAAGLLCGGGEGSARYCIEESRW